MNSETWFRWLRKLGLVNHPSQDNDGHDTPCPTLPAEAPMHLGPTGRLILGLVLLGIGLLLPYLLVAVWPNQLDSGEANPGWSSKIKVLGFQPGEISDDARLLLIVILAGALGSYIHTATSFADFVGNRRMVASWTWWYILRAPIGIALAVLFYFLVRGGLLSAGTGAVKVNLYGIAAIAGLAGMFSKQATDKLREVFDALFKTVEGAKREDGLATEQPKTPPDSRPSEPTPVGRPEPSEPPTSTALLQSGSASDRSTTPPPTRDTDEAPRPAPPDDEAPTKPTNPRSSSRKATRPSPRSSRATPQPSRRPQPTEPPRRPTPSRPKAKRKAKRGR